MRLWREAPTPSHLLEDRGIALVMALGIMFVLSATVISAISYASSNSRSAAHSNASTKALALAEAGLNNARATLWAAPDPRDPTAVPEQTVTLENGTVTYSGSYLDADSVWTLTGTGTVPNPTGGAPIVRTVTARVVVTTGSEGSENLAVWNYLYSDTTSGCMNLANNAVISVPLYVRGNLCLTNNAVITGSPLQVGGTLDTQANGARVGSSGSPIADARLAGGCTGGSPNPHPCTSADKVYATSLTQTTQGLVKPPADFDTWYEQASPGPSNACTTGSFPGGFDNDGTLNGSLGTVDLTPLTAYDCQVVGGGRIAWTPGDPGTLQVSGTILFDGGLSFGANEAAVYQGRATIYANGTITFANASTLCGVSTCDTAWDTNANLLVLVAGSNAQGSSYAFDLSNSSVFQGASYAVGDFREQNNAGVWGSVIANQLTLANNAINHYVPYGTLLPGMPGGSGSVTVLDNVGESYSG
jgi:hypothetical protein